MQSQADFMLKDVKFDRNGINFMHLNIHYLYPKFSEIQFLVNEFKNIDILGLQETFLSDKFSNNEINLHNYQLFRRDRESNGGGIALYVKSNLPCELRTDLDSSNIEAIWLEMKLEKQKPFIVGYIYRPPSSLNSWIEEIEKVLETLYVENKEIILFGDFNYNFINSISVNSKWNNTISTFNLNQLITQPTRVTQTSSTIIDHLYTNQPQNICDIKIPILSISDHFPIVFTRKTKEKIKKGPLHLTINYRYLKQFNAEHFLADLSNQPWTLIDVFTEPDDALDTFYNLFLKVLDSHAPYRQKRVKHKNQNEWFTDEIANAIHMRDYAKKKKKTEEFKYWRSQVKILSHQSKKDFFNQEINSQNKNPKKLWKNLKALSGKTHNFQTNYINDDNGNPVSDPKETAEIFNTFFSNVFKKSGNISALNKANESILKEMLEGKVNLDVPEFVIPPIEPDHVKKTLDSLDVKKATGLDGISGRFLKTASSVIYRPLSI
ncbi:uncharacterized protein LOC132736928 [Ruditapes philippinarum]|uniref:uncharacterized protein LOC132736928 n=1 Tax=Ruditapes philippinarum TaxID=129788 RepID=UPI00295AFDF0|nr:uncharacterized protein LOC132736928 [Ruditapes philippinarum]